MLNQIASPTQEYLKKKFMNKNQIENIPPKNSVYIQAIATMVPSHCYSQQESLEQSKTLMAKTPAEEHFLERIFTGSEIDQRFSVIDDFKAEEQKSKDSTRQLYPSSEDYLPEPSTAQRNKIFSKASRQLSHAVTEKLFNENPTLKPEDVTHLITVSCTGFQAPGFDYHLVESLGLNRSIPRFHIGFMGCFAAFPALKLANEICSNNSEANVLVVHCEICSIHLKFKFDPNTQIANAIFSDGCSAAWVSARKPQGRALRFSQFQSEIIPNTETEMTWDLGNLGFDMQLSRNVPGLLHGIAKDTVNKLVKSENALLWAIHPGGKAILDEWQRALSLDENALDVSRKVLRNYGNMSSVTIYFVLLEFLQSDKTGELFTAAFGPGLTVESALMELG